MIGQMFDPFMVREKLIQTLPKEALGTQVIPVSSALGCLPESFTVEGLAQYPDVRMESQHIPQNRRTGSFERKEDEPWIEREPVATKTPQYGWKSPHASGPLTGVPVLLQRKDALDVPLHPLADAFDERGGFRRHPSDPLAGDKKAAQCVLRDVVLIAA